MHILHVVENDLLMTALTPTTVKVRATESRSAGEQAVAEIRDIADEHGLESVTWVLRTRPSIGRRCVHETIVEYAETNTVDLIVMGSTDRGSLSTLFRPSVTHQVMGATDIPVFGRRLNRDPAYTRERQSPAGRGAEVDN